MWHTCVLHEGVVEEVQHTMSRERDGHKPQVALESDHGGDREHCGDDDFGQQYPVAAIDDGEQNVVRGDDNEHRGVEDPITIHSQQRRSATDEQGKGNAYDVFHALISAQIARQ
jgi:hypothetical protein